MKVLIAEDDPVSRKILEKKLSDWGYEVVSTTSGKEAWKALHRPDSPRLAVLDWMMPEMEGVEICKRIRKSPGEFYVYILLVTAKTQKRDLIEAMEAGADDYLTKPFDFYELRLRLRAGERILKLQETLMATQEALRFQATHDPLTGLWNRSAIIDMLEIELSRARRQGSSIGLIMGDLDHFKKINDTYGHVVGDKVLRVAAQRLSSSVRPYDYIGRYGGEEFLILLPGCQHEDLLGVAERLRKSINESPITINEEKRLSFSISLGAATVDPVGDFQVDQLIKLVDVALYRAKSLGRNRVEVANEEDFRGLYNEGVTSSSRKGTRRRSPQRPNAKVSAQHR